MIQIILLLKISNIVLLTKKKNNQIAIAEQYLISLQTYLIIVFRFKLKIVLTAQLTIVVFLPTGVSRRPSLVFVRGQQWLDTLWTAELTMNYFTFSSWTHTAAMHVTLVPLESLNRRFPRTVNALMINHNNSDFARPSGRPGSLSSLLEAGARHISVRSSESRHGVAVRRNPINMFDTVGPLVVRKRRDCRAICVPLPAAKSIARRAMKTNRLISVALL